MSERKGQNQSGDKKGGIGKIIIALAAIIILLLIIVIILLLKKDGHDDDETNVGSTRQVTESTRLVLDEESAMSVLDEMRKEVEEGMFECNMSMTWTFANGEAESKDAYVANSANNTHPIYFDLYLNDTNELIYSSPVIPVGSQLTDFKLDKALPAGTYKAKCAYSLLSDEESQEVTSNVNFIITLEVLN